MHRSRYLQIFFFVYNFCPSNDSDDDNDSDGDHDDNDNYDDEDDDEGDDDDDDDDDDDWNESGDCKTSGTNNNTVEK